MQNKFEELSLEPNLAASSAVVFVKSKENNPGKPFVWGKKVIGCRTSFETINVLDGLGFLNFFILYHYSFNFWLGFFIYSLFSSTKETINVPGSASSARLFT